ncbi:relaxase/mobilization nuclease domain-containing protein [Chryseobacterium limigenitum]|uniref:Relaxase/Mobilisation nuclease domain-containing protein n=1 Tax=Chryseobacterium limigenitum TaxID=1612149 RepID=A0A1K2IXC5_9FLAO|nr:relaxase/mobilization nuclease domain-containing protein [Chryseobacterium limigenitum]SFZ96930.1 Relaxase/Mobilisation nuclease domain-containing protein [Chryseobacterium limigenitum]
MLNQINFALMLIKILSRKNKSFRSLIGYIDRQTEGQELYWNVPQNATSERLEKEFLENDTYRSSQSKNSMYHHILSFSAKDKAVITPELLESVAQEYIVKANLENHLVYGRVHSDTEHYHWHLISSQNAYHSKKGFRLSKAELKNLQVQMEEFTRLQYPEIKYSYAYSGKRNLTLGLTTSKVTMKPTEQEFQMGKSERSTEKQELINYLKSLATQVHSPNDFEKAIEQDARYGFYTYRDNIHGIMDKQNGKKYRLSTLFQTKDLTAIYRQLKSRHKELENQRENQQDKER